MALSYQAAADDGRGAAVVFDMVTHVAHTLELGRVRACDREQCVDQMARRG